MSNYLETIYFKNEYGKEQYPQLLCNHIAEKHYFKKGGVAGKRLLDIGSGKGNHLVGFARCGMEAYGLDKRDECISALKEFDVRDCDIENEPFPYNDNFFDFVFSKSAVLMTPDWKSQHDFFWDDYTHVKAFTRKSLQNAMIINGFENVDCSYFLQLPIVWKYRWIKCITHLIALLPDSLKWKDKEQREFRTWVRFSKEEMLLAVGYKPNV